MAKSKWKKRDRRVEQRHIASHVLLEREIGNPRDICLIVECNRDGWPTKLTPKRAQAIVDALREEGLAV